MDELYACADIEIKDNAGEGLPSFNALPPQNIKNINCLARRAMILPKKKESKGTKR